MLNKASIEGLRRFLEHAATLKPQNNPKRENGFAKEFQEIKETSSRRKKDPFFSTHHGEKDFNRPKNRYKDIMPYDYSRIILPAIEGKEGSDYINGNYIKGPTDEVSYLAAQGPLPITVNDFWRMIISHQTQVIVMACREYELGKLKCKRYWPEKPDEKLTFDACEVSLISQEEMGDGFVIRTLSAKHPNGELKVTQFHYTAWPDHDVPRSATPLIELTMSFRAFVGNSNNVPVVIHCSAGCGRTGTICALDYALNLIKLGRTDNFSVFGIVSNLRRQRIAMVQTKEQYELVYKAVKDIVSDELLKQRTSMHTYVNVSVGEDVPETENTYENVDFIRSIQRLHEEEKNAARRPKELPSPSKEVVLEPKKGIVLAPQKNNATRHDVSHDRLNDNKQANKLKGGFSANQKQEQKGNVSKDVQQQPAAKPPIKKKPPQSGYENVLPLSAANAVTKPPLVPKPQNYVNVVIGTQKTNLKDDDYVNIPSASTKSVPDPEKIENVSTLSKPVATVNPIQMKPAPPNRSHQKVASVNGNAKDDYVVLPINKKEESNCDYVIPPSVSATVDKRPLDQGHMDGLGDSRPTSFPKFRRRSSDHEDGKFKSLDASLMADLSRSSPSLQTQDSDKCPVHQPKTSGRLSAVGQYSLIGVLDTGSPNRSDVTDPFENAPQIKDIRPKGRSSLGMVEPVVADAEPVKLENPVPAPRRASEATLAVKHFVNHTTLQERLSATHSLPQGNQIVGSYSMVNLPKAEIQEKTELLIDFDDEKVKESSKDILQCRVKKSHSTENIISCKSDLYSSVQKSGKTPLTKQPSLDSSTTNTSSISDVPLTRRKSEDVLSFKKSRLHDLELPQKVATMSVEERKESQDILGNAFVRKKALGVRRSNSNVTTSSAHLVVSDNVDSLYATVGAKTKDKRRPKTSEIFAGDNSPTPSSERRMNRSDNSTSSLRSTNSTSSNDSWDDAPPVPVKTFDALLSPDDVDPYEAVERSSSKSTLNRIKNKAKNMIPSGPHVSKISLGRKNVSNTDSLGRGQDLYISDKGFRTHVGKPQGPRQCPNHWPKFTK